MTAQAPFTLPQKTLLYYRKLYFTTENFTTWKVFFLQNLCQLKFLLPFENQQFFYINWCTRVWIKHKKTTLSDSKMFSLKIKIPCGRYFSCSKVFCSIVKFTIYYI